jgi:hypothetical protein
MALGPWRRTPGAAASLFDGLMVALFFLFLLLPIVAHTAHRHTALWGAPLSHAPTPLPHAGSVSRLGANDAITSVASRIRSSVVPRRRTHAGALHNGPTRSVRRIQSPAVGASLPILWAWVYACSVAVSLVRRTKVSPSATHWATAAMEDTRRGVATSHFYLDDIGYHVLAKADLPALIPRADFMAQMRQWSTWRFEATGYATYGLKMPIVDLDGGAVSYGIRVATPDPLVPSVVLEVGLDDTLLLTKKLTHEAHMHADESRGMMAVAGRYFLVRVRKSPVPLPYDTKHILSLVLKDLSRAVDRYASFGSPFQMDVTYE